MLTEFIKTDIPVIAVLGALLYLPYGIYITKKHGKQTILCHAVKYAFLGCCLSIVRLTVLWRIPQFDFRPEYFMYNFRPFDWIWNEYTMGFGGMIEQLILNIMMFIPLGLLLPLAIKRTRKFHITALVIFTTTLSIELLQLFMGRSCDIDDVIMNFTGGVLGYLIFMLLRRLFSGKAWWDKISPKKTK